MEETWTLSCPIQARQPQEQRSLCTQWYWQSFRLPWWLFGQLKQYSWVPLLEATQVKGRKNAQGGPLCLGNGGRVASSAEKLDLLGKYIRKCRYQVKAEGRKHFVRRSWQGFQTSNAQNKWNAIHQQGYFAWNSGKVQGKQWYSGKNTEGSRKLPGRKKSWFSTVLFSIQRRVVGNFGKIQRCRRYLEKHKEVLRSSLQSRLRRGRLSNDSWSSQSWRRNF